MPVNPVDTVIEAAAQQIEGNESGRVKLANFFGVRPQAIHEFRKKKYLPLDRAKTAAERFGLPLRTLVRPDIAEAMSAGVAQSLLSE